MTIAEATKTFKLVCLGCRVNQYEIQGYRDQLTMLGYVEIFDANTPADLCIVNTCAVTSAAESSGRHAVRLVCRQNPDACLVVTGCLGEADKQFFLSLGRQCLLVPNKEKGHLIAKLFPHLEEPPEFRIRSFEGKSRAFIKVQDGCNSFCSYCIIPYLRGRSVSRSHKAILEEISTLVDRGYREVVVAGINVGDYCDGEVSLASLIQKIDQIQGLERIRISSIDPEDVNEDLCNTLVSCRHTCPSSHLVLQSGSNAILKRMNRKYTRNMFLDCVEKLRSFDPHYTFTTDVIVGFPGESDQDFEDSVKIIEDIGFIKVHIFPYSPRPRTKAYAYEAQIPQKIIAERKKYLAEIAKNVAQREMKKRLGITTSVLVEQVLNSGEAVGHTPYFEKVFFPASLGTSENSLVSVILEDVREDGFLGVQI
ncbi:tRNA (N(6)-L-threonylcarbamoyladenosine(37)-C(2))-methylthiotransferase MtaB [Chlamydia sp. 17-3921]|uniref:tRNA (N(6)-L-threonylcarbamoyladenosine(37)-C(2))- methylthiotransferase MtaB n=1 Tax=Chlamydia sp. 17-3921 TaxID=2675798 RepID=UPI001918B1BC|nr:tRNA (N(6)-L-threonylcarbamoyladenosine(37)-C(2))-methylthiotransferase MtaB [Chlamydia sp. 17-3921]